MNAASAVCPPQNGSEIIGCWQGVPLTGGSKSVSKSPPTRLMSQDVSSSGDEYNTTKVRKPYTITKQREKWTENEHEKFLEALKLYGRAWRRIEEHIGTKTAVQIRSHAQKFFSKVEREASTGGSSTKLQDVEIPPPRPKRKPIHPYPRKAGTSPSFQEEELRSSGVSSAFFSADDNHHHSASLNRINHQVVASATYVGSKGGSSQELHGNPHWSANSLEPQESLKLFGKTVVLLTTPHVVADGKGTLESPAPKNQYQPSTKSGDFKYKVGFSPYVKVGKTTGLSSGGDVSSSNINGIEDMTVDVCGTINGSSDDGHDTNSFSPTTKAMLPPKLGVKHVASRNITRDHSIEEGPPTSLFDDHCAFQTGSQNNPAYLWMDRFFSSYGNVSMPHTELLSAPSATLPWNLMQASAMNQSAAYAAAAAARWAFVGGTQASIGSVQPPSNSFNEGGGQRVPWPLTFSDHQFGAAAFAAAAASWWAFRGLLPPTPPSFVLSPATVAGTSMSSCVNDAPRSTELGGGASSGQTTCNRMVMNEGAAKAQGIEQTTDRESMSSESFVDQENEVAAKMDGGTGSACRGKDQQRYCSSGDELEEEGVVKKRTEGSSSGSNTPVFRSNSSELDPNTSGSDVKNSNNAYDWGRAAESNGSPETMSTKSTEKGKKHAHRDCKNGETDNGKRLKSSIHDTDLRKEVSQEGRKAFQALFVSKTLPQTFPVKGSPTGSIAVVAEKHVCKPSSMDRTNDSSCFQEEEAEVYKPPPPQSDGSTDAQAKAFRIYSLPERSGFVPYERPHPKHQAAYAFTKSKS